MPVPSQGHYGFHSFPLDIVFVFDAKYYLRNTQGEPQTMDIQYTYDCKLKKNPRNVIDDFGT
jgi:hypothetical protein